MWFHRNSDFATQQNKLIRTLTRSTELIQQILCLKVLFVPPSYSVIEGSYFTEMYRTLFNHPALPNDHPFKHSDIVGGTNCKTLKQTPYSDNKTSEVVGGRGREIKSKLVPIKCSELKCRFSEEEVQNK